MNSVEFEKSREQRRRQREAARARGKIAHAHASQPDKGAKGSEQICKLVYGTLGFGGEQTLLCFGFVPHKVNKMHFIISREMIKLSPSS